MDLQARINRISISSVQSTIYNLQSAIALERERAERLIATLDEWMADESGYDEATWPGLADALDHARDQLGMRRLFDE